ncbi:hypothetical protein CQ14_32425 [Bradyrhizobium lablabi]|uniref:Uncharacterized protein n=1 Tax=Bradyrhizobium lablabi TaxID=722472 RepID=A0A0R3MZZ8_9BRAD|nr:hypothetical protein CQ14_32425 [Bradyrhizobium lablabi]
MLQGWCRRYGSDGVLEARSAWANRISSAMLWISSLRIAFSRCLRTVSGLMRSFRAISLLVSPSPTSPTISISRGRSCQPPGKRS